MPICCVSRGKRVGQSILEVSRYLYLYEPRLNRNVGPLKQAERAKAIVSFRYTTDSYGQGVHEGQPVHMSLFPGVERVATNISANVLRLQECQPPGWGDPYGRVSCSE
jgi:hypothetical protein